jgi:putative RNA 2'-phosphotransferase
MMGKVSHLDEARQARAGHVSIEEIMDTKRMVRVSKYLSLHLRHQPEALGLVLQEGGWVEVAELLAACARKHFPIEQDELKEVVANNDKKRFAFDDSGTRIRANQGHSVEVDLQLEPRDPPALLYHGTPERSVGVILENGLLKMERHHVHLSATTAEAIKVGQRRGKPVVLQVDAAGLHAGGGVFYLSTNGVWLVDQVPPAYLKVLEK